MMDNSMVAGLIPLHVLHHACKESVFGLELIEELAWHGYRLSPGTLYPLLHSMEAKGLLQSRRELVIGRVRRVYRATPAGEKMLALAKERVRELFGELFEDEDQPAMPGHRGHRNLRKAFLRQSRLRSSQRRSK